MSPTKRTTPTNQSPLDDHITRVLDGERHFENVYQSISRMILADPAKIDRVTVNGRRTYDFRVFRDHDKHIIGMFD